MSVTLRSVGKNVAKIVVVGTIIGLMPSAYDASRFLSRSRVFEQMSIGLPEKTASEILVREGIRCGTSLYRDQGCQFSDLWRDYEVKADPSTQAVSSLSYFPRRRPSILQRIFGSY